MKLLCKLSTYYVLITKTFEGPFLEFRCNTLRTKYLFYINLLPYNVLSLFVYFILILTRSDTYPNTATFQRMNDFK